MNVKSKMLPDIGNNNSPSPSALAEAVRARVFRSLYMREFLQ